MNPRNGVHRRNVARVANGTAVRMRSPVLMGVVHHDGSGLQARKAQQHKYDERLEPRRRPRDESPS